MYRLCYTLCNEQTNYRNETFSLGRINDALQACHFLTFFQDISNPTRGVTYSLQVCDGSTPEFALATYNFLEVYTEWCNERGLNW
jgi:hypothetical protein